MTNVNEVNDRLSDTLAANAVHGKESLFMKLFSGLITAEPVGYSNAFEDKLKIKGLDSDGNAYDKDNFNYVKLQKAINTIDEANAICNRIQEQEAQNRTFVEKTNNSQFLGTGHAEAYDAMRRGEITPETFAKIENQWKEYYDRLLINADFTKKPVYAWSADSGEGIQLNAVDNADIPDLKGEILLAMKEGRCEYSLSTRGGTIGTMITIMPKNESGEGKEGWSKKKGEVHKVVFVEGLFDETANDVFERDTKTIAARKNDDMKHWNYEQTLSSGATVGYDEYNNSYVKTTDSDGNITAVPIDEDQMLHLLNEDAIITSSINKILSNMDSNGNMLPQNINGRLVTPSIDNLLQTFATAGTNELYPQGSTTEVSRAAYQNQLYLKLREQLNKYYRNYKTN